MAFVVHDLKNPVSTLDLHAQLLLRDKTLSASSQESARAIRNEAGLLVRQINTLLDLSKGDEADLSGAPGPVDLEELIAHVRRSFESRAKTKELAMAVKVAGARVLADRDLMRRVVENLLDNALRHAPHGTTVTIAAEDAADGVTLRIADQGLGIPEHMRERVFERYVQAGDVRSPKGSYGLGLAFCKLAVEHQGGRIWIEDGQPGATFCVSLRHVV